MSYQPAAPAARPKSVQTAVTLIWVGIAVGVISAIISFATIDSQLEAAGVDPDQAGAGAAVVIGGVIGLIISVGVPVLLAIFIGKGANWARIVYTILGAIGVLFGLFGLIGAPILTVLLQLVSIVVTVAVIVLLFRPDSNAFFSR